MKKFFSHPKWNLVGALLLVVGLSAGLWIGCSEHESMPSQPVESQEPPVLSKANPRVQSVMAVQEQHTDVLFTHPEVVGTGTGINDDGELSIVVYTTTEVDQLPVDLESLVNEAALEAIPDAIDNIPVEVKVSGMFKIFADPTARFDRPVPIGVSTGHPDITAGTIGCRVKDSQGNVYALSNNHIYANANEASIGDNELQPGPSDGGQDPEDAIGTLYDYEAILFDGSDNYIDAAIASTSTGYVGTATPGDGYGTPSSTTKSATIGMNVQKYGRTTGWTHGEVAELNVTVEVCYETRGPFNCVKSAVFVDQIAITPGDFSGGGDSGSLIVTDDGNNNPVALLFAGSSSETLANPIGAVLSRFNVTVDDGSGGTANDPPTADFTYTTTDLTVDFTDQSSDSDGSIASWSWDFGDGATSTSQNPSHTYDSDGTYTVTLTVTDDDGATDSASKDVTVSGSTTNDPPTADFTYTTTDLTVDFTDQSSDSDGSIASWSWDFGDGATSTSQNPSHTYDSDGTYTVTLTVTDDDGATDSASKDVTVSGSSGDFTLTATGYKYRGLQKADLEWSGATGTDVEIYRDGVLIATTANDGFYTDNIDRRGGGSYVYQVCEIGGSPCSNQSTVTF